MMAIRTGAVRALMAGLLLMAAAAAPAVAQTPEGTEITNTATVSYTDANGNTYADVSASVTVTVGFQAGVSVAGGEADTPAPGTSGDMTFTITNVGNGTDTLQVAVTNSNSSVMDVTGYQVGGTTYGTLAELNTALAPMGVAAGTDLVITVLYDVSAGTGGQTASFALTAASHRDAGIGDASAGSTGTVSPSETLGVTVTPDAQVVEQLPSNGTVYEQTFTITNNGTGPETFDLAATGGAMVTIGGILVGGSAATEIEIAAGASEDVVVEYEVAAGAAGTTEDVELSATAQSDGAVTDAGSITVERVSAALTITKRALDGERSAQVTAILPGQYIEYEITVTNGGTSPAEDVVVTDELDSDFVTYVSSENTGGAWTPISTSTNGDGNTVVTATLADPLAAGASATFYVRVQVD